MTWILGGEARGRGVSGFSVVVTSSLFSFLTIDVRLSLGLGVLGMPETDDPEEVLSLPETFITFFL